jgi:hypothetical protein
MLTRDDTAYSYYIHACIHPSKDADCLLKHVFFDQSFFVGDNQQGGGTPTRQVMPESVLNELEKAKTSIAQRKYKPTSKRPQQVLSACGSCIVIYDVSKEVLLSAIIGSQGTFLRKLGTETKLMSKNIYIYIYIYTYIHTCIYTCIHTFICTYIYI